MKKEIKDSIDKEVTNTVAFKIWIHSKDTELERKVAKGKNQVGFDYLNSTMSVLSISQMTVIFEAQMTVIMSLIMLMILAVQIKDHEEIYLIPMVMNHQQKDVN